MMKRSIVVIMCDALSVFMPGAITFGLLGLLMPTWAEMFQVGRGPASLVMTVLVVALGVGMFFAGSLSDRFGARIVMSIGAVVGAIVFYLFSIASSLPALYVCSFFFGLAISFVYLPALSSVQRWFPKRRGMASGVVNLVFGISAAIMVPVFRIWLANIGYAWVITIAAILYGVIGLIVAQFTEFPKLPAPVAGSPETTARPVLTGKTLKETVKTLPFWLLWGCWALAGGAGIGMVMNSTSIAMSLGFTGAAVVLCLTFFNITNGISRIITGLLSDRFGRRPVLCSAFVLGAIGNFLIPVLGGNLTALLIFNLLAGFSFGTLFAVSAPLAMDCFGVKHWGAIFGIMFTGYGFVGSWDGPFMGGQLADITGSYSVTCILFGAFCLISAIAVLFVKKPISSE